MYLRDIVESLARDRGEPVEVTAAATTATAREFFRLPAR
jgi:TatD DNase family protein